MTSPEEKEKRRKSRRRKLSDKSKEVEKPRNPKPYKRQKDWKQNGRQHL